MFSVVTIYSKDYRPVNSTAIAVSAIAGNITVKVGILGPLLEY